jgi:hypothetical protein
MSGNERELIIISQLPILFHAPKFFSVIYFSNPKMLSFVVGTHSVVSVVSCYVSKRRVKIRNVYGANT